MRALFRKIRDSRFRYNPLIEIRIFREHVLHNLKQFAELNKEVKIAPVLKSNAYGHGLVQVARILDGQEGVSFFMVDSYYEALVLRNEGITTPILVLGYVFPEGIAASKLKNVSYGITTLNQLKGVARLLKYPQNVHIKVDTGMHRQGLLSEELDAAIEIIKSNSNIRVEGFCSHFADADGEDSSFTEKQKKLWNQQKTAWQRAFPETRHYHLANTAGTRSIAEGSTNVARVGLGLYGIDPLTFGKSAGVDSRPNSDLELKPVLEMRTILTGIKKFKKGEKVGYNITFTAPHDMTIATVPVGYYEGVDRALSNKGVVYVKDVACSIVGRVSMNITSVDVSGVPDVKEGDEAVVISSDPSRENSVENIASQCETIPYDILVHVPSFLRRVVVE